MALETEFMTCVSSLTERKLSTRLQARSSCKYLYFANHKRDRAHRGVILVLDPHRDVRPVHAGSLDLIQFDRHRQLKLRVPLRCAGLRGDPLIASRQDETPRCAVRAQLRARSTRCSRFFRRSFLPEDIPRPASKSARRALSSGVSTENAVASAPASAGSRAITVELMISSAGIPVRGSTMCE